MIYSSKPPLPPPPYTMLGVTSQTSFTYLSHVIRLRVSPFLAWGDFHARLRFARSTIPEEKWGTTRSLTRYGLQRCSGSGGVGWLGAKS